MKAISLHGLSEPALGELGGVLARATRVLEAIVKPEKFYCAHFGEEASSVHFHVFPRTAAITIDYMSEHPDQSEQINGPALFVWARRKYKATPERVWVAVELGIAGLRSAFHP